MRYSDCDDFIETFECGTKCVPECEYTCTGCEESFELSISGCGNGGWGKAFRIPLDYPEREALAQSLLPLESLDKAVTYLELNEITPTHYRETETGYDFIYRELTSDCIPVVSTRFWIHLNTNGTWSTYKEVEIKCWDNRCI